MKLHVASHNYDLNTTKKFGHPKDKAAVFDVYAIDFLASENRQPDLIYIKLRLLENNQLWVSLGSFHL